MIFWIITLAMACMVVAVLARAMWRADAGGLEATAAFDLQVYRDQLAEVDRDVARGVVSAEDAERVRTEISRRILAADAAVGQTAGGGQGPSQVVMAVIAMVLLAGSVGMYQWLGQPGYGDMRLQARIDYAEEVRQNRAGQEVAMAAFAEQQEPVELSERYTTLLEQLRTTVKNNPDDVRGQRFLAQYEGSAGNFEAALAAQRRVLELLGDQATPEDLGDYGELLVLAAGGYVSPEAEAVLREVLLRDREDGRARYYLGLMLVQTGRPDQGFRMWDALLRRGPADALWIEPIKAQIMDVASLAGVDYTLPAIGPGQQRGPSAEDIEAAGEMTAEERLEMIGGMVAGLSDRLAREGGPPRDWARLITSLGVLGERERARAIYDNAVEVFGADPGAMDIINRAGSQAGVAE